MKCNKIVNLIYIFYPKPIIEGFTQNCCEMCHSPLEVTWITDKGQFKLSASIKEVMWKPTKKSYKQLLSIHLINF